MQKGFRHVYLRENQCCVIKLTKNKNDLSVELQIRTYSLRTALKIIHQYFSISKSPQKHFINARTQIGQGFFFDQTSQSKF